VSGSDLDPVAIDQARVRTGFERAAGRYDGADFLQAEVRERLLERLELVRLDPAWVLDLGAGTGRALPALAARFPAARLLALDLSPAMLGRAAGCHPAALPVCADAGRLPLAEASVDLVFSSLMLHWAPDMGAVLDGVRRVLRYPGLFSFATLGPDSYRELRAAWAAADDYPHVLAFPEMHGLGDALVQAGFQEPVLATEALTITYPDVRALARDLKDTGTANATAGRPRGLTSPGRWARMAAAYERYRDTAGRLPATIEIVFGQAWAPDPAARRAGAGETSFPLSRLGLRR
jgi:malonyl-CoA O-methyltransferase